MKIGIITQARATSTRLPAKVLLTAGGRTFLQYHLDRLAATGLPVIVATTTNADDEPIVEQAGEVRLPGLPGQRAGRAVAVRRRDPRARAGRASSGSPRTAR